MSERRVIAVVVPDGYQYGWEFAQDCGVEVVGNFVERSVTVTDRWDLRLLRWLSNQSWQSTDVRLVPADEASRRLIF